MPRVVVVDDQKLVQRGLTLMLQAADGVEVVGSGDGVEALELIEQTRPDVVLLDLEMPDVDGFTVLRELRHADHRPVVAVLTTFDSAPYVQRALDLGAAGFLLKDTAPEALGSFVHTLAAGGMLFSPSVGAVLPRRTQQHVYDAIDALSERERAVLRLVALGLTNAEVGRELHLAAATVKDHVSAILRKLGVATRVHAALYAERANLLEERDR